MRSAPASACSPWRNGSRSGEDAAADAIARLDDGDRGALFRELARGSEAGESGPGDENGSAAHADVLDSVREVQADEGRDRSSAGLRASTFSCIASAQRSASQARCEREVSARSRLAPVAAPTCRATRLVPSGDRSDSTALRTMAGLPGRRSIRPIVTGDWRWEWAAPTRAWPRER